jgi:transcriptional regulator with XRE-family HTH domain
MTELNPDELSQVVREEIARRRISRQSLADMAKISLSTLEKALAGTRPFTLASIIRIEEALGTRLRPSELQSSPQELAPAHLGSYSHIGIKWIEGRYLTLRPSFKNPGELFSYAIDIRWNESAGYLTFTETPTIDGVLYGILTTLQVGHGSQLVPVSCPVALVKWEDAVYPMIGSVTQNCPEYERYRLIVDAATSGDYVRFYE